MNDAHLAALALEHRCTVVSGDHEVARCVREVLDELALDARVMATGARGLHVRVPIEPTPGPRLRSLTLAIARMVVDRHPTT